MDPCGKGVFFSARPWCGGKGGAVARVVVAEVRWPVVSGSHDLCGGEVASGQWTSSIFVEVR